MSFFDDLFAIQSGSVGDASFGVIDFLVEIVSGTVQYMVSIVNAVVGFILGVFKSVTDFLAHLWDSFFSKIFVNLFHAIRNLTVWLETHIQPIIDWLRRAQQYILNLYTRYVRPILVMIQRIRQVLTILRALHVQWAQDLDNILAHVQSDINGVFLKITGTLNAVIDVLNIVTDPARLLRHPMLVLSVRRSILALIRQLTGLPPGFWLPSRSASAASGTGRLPFNFNPLDPIHNPPPSYYMGLSTPVPSLEGWSSGQELPDDYADDVAPLDFFNPDLAPPRQCQDSVTCFLQAVADARARA